MIAYYDTQQDKKLKLLKKQHILTNKNEIKNLKELWVELDQIKFKQRIDLSEVYYLTEWLSWSINRIYLSYNQFNKVIYEDRELRLKWELELYLQGFFQNAKMFLEIMKKIYFKTTGIQSEWNDLLKEVTYLRNMFAHSYEKDFNNLPEEKLLVSLEYNPHITYVESWIIKLDMYNLVNSDNVWSIYFSLDKIYYDIGIILSKVIKYEGEITT